MNPKVYVVMIHWHYDESTVDSIFWSEEKAEAKLAELLPHAGNSASVYVVEMEIQ